MSFQNNKLKKLIMAAMFGAIICVVTMVVKIPLPLGGYVHLGDAFIILAGLYLGWVYGGTAAGIGSMLADVFTGYVIHPHSMSLDNRKRCLYTLKEIGYQVGSGFNAKSYTNKCEKALFTL